jgi:hypothetical protein
MTVAHKVLVARQLERDLGVAMGLEESPHGRSGVVTT